MQLTVDVISDVICPWCFIGKRRLEKAIVAHGGSVKVRWHPYQLNPNMPKEGISRNEYRTKKFGSWERSQELDARMVAVGKDEGIDFNFNRIERTPNTLDVHRLIWLAGKEGCQDTAVEALFLAYFTDGRDISNPQTLLDVIVEARLDRSKAAAILNSDEALEAIGAAEELYRGYHLDGVPFFRINEKIMLSGAQQPDTFREVFRRLDIQ